MMKVEMGVSLFGDEFQEFFKVKDSVKLRTYFEGRLKSS